MKTDLFNYELGSDTNLVFRSWRRIWCKSIYLWGYYVGAIPFFSASIGWLIRNYRKGRSIVLPALSAMFFFISAYLYLMFAGKNVPWWVYGAVVLLILVGAYSTIAKVRRRISEPNGVMEVKR